MNLLQKQTEQRVLRSIQEDGDDQDHRDRDGEVSGLPGTCPTVLVPHSARAYLH